LRKWRAITDGITPSAISDEVVKTLADDLNTSGVIALLHQYANAGDGPMLKAAANLIGLLSDEMGDWIAPTVDLGAYETALFDARQTAIASKNFDRVDQLKSLFQSAGLEVRMSKTGVELVPSVGFDITILPDADTL
jgi:cysteinyl-tRNA synthetase